MWKLPDRQHGAAGRADADGAAAVAAAAAEMKTTPTTTSLRLPPPAFVKKCVDFDINFIVMTF